MVSIPVRFGIETGVPAGARKVQILSATYSVFWIKFSFTIGSRDLYCG
jgi:hypothetical protein